MLQRETALRGCTGPRRTMVRCWAQSPVHRGHAFTAMADGGKEGLHSAWGSVKVGG